MTRVATDCVCDGFRRVAAIASSLANRASWVSSEDAALLPSVEPPVKRVGRDSVSLSAGIRPDRQVLDAVCDAGTELETLGQKCLPACDQRYPRVVDFAKDEQLAVSGSTTQPLCALRRSNPDLPPRSILFARSSSFHESGVSYADCSRLATIWRISFPERSAAANVSLGPKLCG
jgi:hypothetical protein